MIKFARLTAVAAVMVAAMPLAAEAFPVATAPAASADVTLISGGCGLAFHRGPLGGCRPNVVVAPMVVAPVVRRAVVCRTVLLPLPHNVCR